MITLRTKLAAAGAALALAGPVALAAPAFAGNQLPNPVMGTVACANGTNTITWTVDNTVGEIVDIDSAVLTGAVTGNVTFSPNPIPIDESATGTTAVPGSTTGAVVITVATSWVDGEFPDSTEQSFTVNLTACVAPTTTTTSTSTSTTTTTAPSTTTTTTPPAVVAVVVQPTFTG